MVRDDHDRTSAIIHHDIIQFSWTARLSVRLISSLYVVPTNHAKISPLPITSFVDILVNTHSTIGASSSANTCGHATI